MKKRFVKIQLQEMRPQQPCPTHLLQLPKRPRAQPCSAPSRPAQRLLQWKTIYAFAGIGSRQTIAFRIGNCWRLVWNCDPAAVEGLACMAVCTVQAPDGRGEVSGMQRIWQQHTAFSVYEIYGGGEVYLHIISSGEWTVQVQEPEEARSSHN